MLNPPRMLSLAHRVCGPVLGVFRGVRVEGVEQVPQEGRVIVAVNHVSLLDAPLVSLALGRRRCAYFLAKQELFRIPGLGAILRSCGCIPLNRFRADICAVRAAIGVLDAGGCLVLFPEGTRSKDGRPGRPRAGVGLLARRTGACVVPARVRNTESLFARAPLSVRFGPLLRYEGGAGRRGCMEFADRVMDAVFKL